MGVLYEEGEEAGEEGEGNELDLCRLFCIVLYLFVVRSAQGFQTVSSGTCTQQLQTNFYQSVVLGLDNLLLHSLPTPEYISHDVSTNLLQSLS